MQKFIALWLHRYKKYTHLFKVYFYFFKVYLKIWLLKIKFGGKRKIIVIVLTQQFGDIVASEPISRQVRKENENDYIFWIVKPSFKELLLNNPNIDGIIEEYCANQRKLLLDSSIFDKVYNLQFRNNSYCSICNIYVDNLEADAENITIHNYFFQGNLLTIQQKIAKLPVDDIAPIVYITNQEKIKIDSLNLPEKFIVIHCQSAQNNKNWSSFKWLALIEYLLQKTDYQVIEIGLASDLNTNQIKYTNLCGKLSLLETAEVIRRAQLYIGVDSGPAHLANAVNTFGIIMVGKLDHFTNQMPYSGLYKSGKNAIIVRNSEGSSSEIEVNEVIQTIINSKSLLK